MSIRAPYTYFGGKSRVAAEIWKRFGDPEVYIEPFFGSGAVLLARDRPGKHEHINDLNCFLINFWRAIKHDPEAVADYADTIISEQELAARHLWLLNEGKGIVERCWVDPDFYDVKAAGFWIYGMAIWFGAGWGVESFKMELGEAPGRDIPPQFVRQLAHCSSVAMPGRIRKLPNHMPQGVLRRLPKGRERGIDGDLARRDFILRFFAALHARLRHVKISSGDWKRLVSPCISTEFGTTAVLLDPPYLAEGRSDYCYLNNGDAPAIEARDWAIANGDNPKLRIALCGYEGDYDMPGTWEKYAWKTAGGWSRIADTAETGAENAKKERIWFSPHCIKPGRQLDLFSALAGAP